VLPKSFLDGPLPAQKRETNSGPRMAILHFSPFLICKVSRVICQRRMANTHGAPAVTLQLSLEHSGYVLMFCSRRNVKLRPGLMEIETVVFLDLLPHCQHLEIELFIVCLTSKSRLENANVPGRTVTEFTSLPQTIEKTFPKRQAQQRGIIVHCKLFVHFVHFCVVKASQPVSGLRD